YFSISAVRSRLLTALPCHHHRAHGLVCLVTGRQLRRGVECWPAGFVTKRGSAVASAKTSDRRRAIEFPLFLPVTNITKILYRILRLLTRAALYRDVTNSPRSDWVV